MGVFVGSAVGVLVAVGAGPTVAVGIIGVAVGLGGAPTQVSLRVRWFSRSWSRRVPLQVTVRTSPPLMVSEVDAAMTEVAIRNGRAKSSPAR